MSTSRGEFIGFGQLDVRNPHWPRVDVGDLEGASPRDVLVGAVTPRMAVPIPDEGGRLGDLVGTYWAALFLVSDAFVGVLRRESLTGWRVEPVQLTGHRNLPALFLLQVTGTCGQIATIGVGRSIQLDTWDGADLFVAANDATIFLSERAAVALRNENLGNVEIEPAGVEVT